MIKVSIIMPAYNCEKSIKKSIESVLMQKYDEFELIVIDDGSTDSTYKICKNIKNSKINVIHQNNSGPSSARNLGISLAKGKYLMFIDSDDIFLEDAIKTMYYEAEKKQLDLVTCAYVCFDGNREYKPIKLKAKEYNRKEEYIDYLQSKGAFNSNWNKIYKKSIIDKYGIKFDVSKEIGEDVRFNFEYIKYAKKFSTSNNVLYKYFLNENGLTRKNDSSKEKRILNLLIYQKKYYKELRLNTSKFQKKVFKDFFHIYNKNEKFNDEFNTFISNFENKKIYLKILNYLCKRNKKITINNIIKIYNRIRS